MSVNDTSSKTCLTCRGRFDTTDSVCPLDGALLVAADSLEGSIFDGKYQLVAFAGAGGFGMVYKAKQLQLERIVAIKILKSLATNDPDCVRRFIREAKAASELVHPHVGSVYAFGIADSGEAYLVMEYLDGRRLCDILASDGPMPLERALGIMRQVCDAVAAAHRHKIIHRDLKPANIMIVPSGNQSELVKVVDFGSAKFLGQQSLESQQVTRPGELIGTIDYMSPEQSSGGEVDARSDVYALGKVLYELVNLDGRVPTGIQAVIERALQADPERRFVDADEMLRELNAVAKEHHGPAVSTMKLLSVSEGHGHSRARFKRIVGALLMLSIMSFAILIIASDEWCARTANVAISICETLQFGSTESFDDFLRSLEKTIGRDRPHTCLNLADAIQRHIKGREGESVAWVDEVITLLKARKSEGQALRNDSVFLAANRATEVRIQAPVNKKNPPVLLRYSKQLLALRQAALPASDHIISEAALLVANCVEFTGDGAAIAAYDRYLKLSDLDLPSDDSWDRAQAFLRLAKINARQRHLDAAQQHVASAVLVLTKTSKVSSKTCMGFLFALIEMGRELPPDKRLSYCDIWQPHVLMLFTLPRPRSDSSKFVCTQFDLLRSSTFLAQGKLNEAQKILRTAVVRSGSDPLVTGTGRLGLEDYLVGLVEQSFLAKKSAAVKPLLELAQTSANRDVRFVGLYAQLHYDFDEYNWKALFADAEKACKEVAVVGSFRGEDAGAAKYAGIAAHNLGNYKAAESYLKTSLALGQRPDMIAEAKAMLGSTYLATGKPAQALELFIGANKLYDLHKLKRPDWLYSMWTEALQKMGQSGEVGAVLALRQESGRKDLIQY